MKNSSKTSAKGALFALLGGMSWGFSGSVGQYMFQVLGMDSRWLVPIRLSSAGVILLIYSLLRYKKTVFQPWKKKDDALRLLIYGIPGVAFCQFCYFSTIQYSSAAVGTIMQDLAPIPILLVTCLLARRLPKGFELLSIALAIIGVLLLTTHGRFDGSGISRLAIIFGIASALCVTVYNMVPGKILQKYPVAMLQGWSFLLGGIVIAIVFQSWKIKYTPNLMGILCILFVIVVGNLVAFNLYMSGVKYAGPEKAILFGFSEPITAAIITVVFLGSRFTWVDAVGFAMIFVMLVMNSMGNKKKGLS